MSRSANTLGPSEAARRLGVSPKALRLYERRGLLVPGRTSAGWRVYDPDDMECAERIVALRSLGLGLTAIADALAADGLAQTLATHEARLQAKACEMAEMIARVRAVRADLGGAAAPVVGDGGPDTASGDATGLCFPLPWPWDGEEFVMRDLPAITYITGPLGSGKTRLAQSIADNLRGAVFVSMESSAGDAAGSGSDPDADAVLSKNVDRIMMRLAADGARPSCALLSLVTAFETPGPTAFVVDMVEHGLDEASQRALIADLRRRPHAPADRVPALFLLTRSTAILDLALVGAGEAILYCPANHSPPLRVHAHPGAPGYEALCSCLASPTVRARTKGVIAVRTHAA